TAGKPAQQQSPFRHLLKPKAGGIAFVLDAMGEQLESIINVTIHYPDGQPGYWDLLCGNVKDVVAHFEEIRIPPQFIGKNYDQDGEYRLQFQQWINGLWEEKDRLLDTMHEQYPGRRDEREAR
ncbi:acyltransferase, partial [Pseudomonas syringae]|nr:acyltransferase [Pseudomonas syringae]